MSHEPHQIDPKLYGLFSHSFESLDLTYLEWLESEFKSVYPFRAMFEQLEFLIIQHGYDIDTKEIRKNARPL